MSYIVYFKTNKYNFCQQYFATKSSKGMSYIVYFIILLTAHPLIWGVRNCL